LGSDSFGCFGGKRYIFGTIFVSGAIGIPEGAASCPVSAVRTIGEAGVEDQAMAEMDGRHAVNSKDKKKERRQQVSIAIMLICGADMEVPGFGRRINWDILRTIDGTVSNNT
jgi:hypothetical protein